MKISAAPWRKGGSKVTPTIYSNEGLPIAQLAPGKEAQANAALIIRALDLKDWMDRVIKACADDTQVYDWEVVNSLMHEGITMQREFQ